MIRYFVIASDGQKYGPADIPTLNTWIAEGRLHPHTMLQEEASSVQVEARGVPALKFVQRQAPPSPAAPPPSGPPAPGAAPNLGNPYDTPRPGAYQPPTFSSNYPRGPQYQPDSGMSGQLVLVWLATIAAPFLIFFFWIGGLLASSFGLRGGFALYNSGYRTQGIVLITLNIVWVALWFITRVVLRIRYGPFQ